MMIGPTITLKSVRELAKGITYTEPLPTGWKPRRLISKEAIDKIRRKNFIIADGEDVPQPVDNFKDMMFPQPILRKLKEKGVIKPSPIQIQGLPVVLSGRDMIGIAPTGSGKTLVFVLPLVMVALQEEIMMPIGPGEGPFCLIISPSRELARQMFLEVEFFLQSLYGPGSGYPKLRSLLCTGGMDIKSELEDVKKKGVHIVVATPGRLKDLLCKKRLNLDNCRYLTLDEADRLVDQRFQDEIKDIFDHFKEDQQQRQTVLFSATMPKRTRDFAAGALVKPVVVSVGGGNASNIIQQVEYVKQSSSKDIQLLESLQKTSPPVIVFCKSKLVVDHVHEYLLIKGVYAVGLHGDKDQEERIHALESFKEKKADVLVATDVASKGLDFSDCHIEHVINYDMPDEIEDYVHRIGRTGRRGRRGLATTFINITQIPTTILLDLKHFLVKTKQIVPQFLQELNDDATTIGTNGVDGCIHCGGLGHGVQGCPRLEREMKKQIAGLKRDYYTFSGGCAEM